MGPCFIPTKYPAQATPRGVVPLTSAWSAWPPSRTAPSSQTKLASPLTAPRPSHPFSSSSLSLPPTFPTAPLCVIPPPSPVLPMTYPLASSLIAVDCPSSAASLSLGGALYLYETSAHVTSCTFSDNMAGDGSSGGAIGAEYYANNISAIQLHRASSALARPPWPTLQRGPGRPGHELWPPRLLPSRTGAPAKYGSGVVLALPTRAQLTRKATAWAERFLADMGRDARNRSAPATRERNLFGRSERMAS